MLRGLSLIRTAALPSRARAVLFTHLIFSPLSSTQSVPEGSVWQAVSCKSFCYTQLRRQWQVTMPAELQDAPSLEFGSSVIQCPIIQVLFLPPGAFLTHHCILRFWVTVASCELQQVLRKMIWLALCPLWTLSLQRVAITTTAVWSTRQLYTQ